jgi:cyanophycinase
MAGYLFLAGGAEFQGVMQQPDQRAIELAGGLNVPISVLPTAVAADQRYQTMGSRARLWFRELGAKRVEVLPVTDKRSANDPWMANYISQSRLIYLTDGFVTYAHRTLQGSACLEAMRDAYKKGAVLAGSGAGAMLLCQFYFAPAQRQIAAGWGFLPNTCVLPHHNLFGVGWVERLTRAIPEIVVLGIDQQTAIVDDGEAGRKVDWSIYGQGGVTLYRHNVPVRYNVGQRLIDSFK